MQGAQMSLPSVKGKVALLLLAAEIFHSIDPFFSSYRLAIVALKIFARYYNLFFYA